MFSKEKNGTPERQTTSNNSATLISPGTTVEGDLKSESDLRIDGTIHGNVFSTAKVIVGATGHVEGNIDGGQADITGKVHGNITVKDLLQLRGQCNVQGNICSGKLQVEPTATFNGQCKMGTDTSVVQMVNDDVQAEAQ
ncbi:MAG: polymer-forming cytoskeletal protein [Flavisolibacter sp.]|nr:polymer-forming cytoskeletal protein [Flavisolibacter sp.]